MMTERPPIDWKVGGLALGLVFFLAVALIKPVGVSTQFVVLDGALWDLVAGGVLERTVEGWTASNAYLAKYAGESANLWNYGFVFVLALAVGAAASSWLRGGVPGDERTVPAIWRANMGGSIGRRMAVAFAGGALVLFGARLAGGCTSGHMMSGMMQTAVSGYVFSLGAFGAAVPTALYLYRSEG